jgi:hypothetical protein
MTEKDVEGNSCRIFEGAMRHLPRGTEEKKQLEKWKASEGILTLQFILAELSSTFQRN